MPWKRWNKTAIDFQVVLTNWPDSVKVPGASFDTRTTQPIQSKSANRNGIPDGEYPPVQLDQRSPARISRLCMDNGSGGGYPSPEGMGPADWVQNILCSIVIGPAVCKNISCPIAICPADWVQNILCPIVIGPAVCKNIFCTIAICPADWVQNILCPIVIGPAVCKNIPCSMVICPAEWA